MFVIIDGNPDCCLRASHLPLYSWCCRPPLRSRLLATKDSFRARRMTSAALIREIESISFIPRRGLNMNGHKTEEGLILYGQRFESRLLLSTSRYASPWQIGGCDPSRRSRHAYSIRTQPVARGGKSRTIILGAGFARPVG
jgi:hypothetical protein